MADASGSSSSAGALPSSGNQVTSGTSYQLLTSAEAAGDTTAPVVANLSPASGSTITPNTPLLFDVTDAVGFRRIIIKVAFAGLSHWEVAHDSDSFAANYATGSTRTVIANGYRYSLVRAGGWPTSPTITPYALDTSGNEAL